MHCSLKAVMTALVLTAGFFFWSLHGGNQHGTGTASKGSTPSLGRRESV